MFDNLKGMAGLAGMMKDLPRIKAKIDEVKSTLGHLSVEAETGGGAVRATANGRLEVTGIRIDPAIFGALIDGGAESDRAMAEDLITGAVNAALAKAREAAEQEFAAAAQELGVPLPPGGLGGLMS